MIPQSIIDYDRTTLSHYSEIEFDFHINSLIKRNINWVDFYWRQWRWVCESFQISKENYKEFLSVLKIDWLTAKWCIFNMGLWDVKDNWMFIKYNFDNSESNVEIYKNNILETRFTTKNIIF